MTVTIDIQLQYEDTDQATIINNVKAIRPKPDSQTNKEFLGQILYDHLSDYIRRGGRALHREAYNDTLPTPPDITVTVL